MLALNGWPNGLYSAQKQHKGMMDDVCRAPVRSDTLHFVLGAFRKLVGGLEQLLFYHILGIVNPIDFHIFQIV